MPRQSDKRARLIKAAKTLLLKKGYNETTLADIAQEAEVPLGNVYYYFKTKEAIGLAVIQQHMEDLDLCFAEWNLFSTPKERLQALSSTGYQSLEDTISWGCMIGSLCQELCKSTSSLSQAAAQLMNKLIDWVQAQFTALGKNEQARNLAIRLISHMQGIALLSNTFKDQEIAIHQKADVQNWLDKAV